MAITHQDLLRAITPTEAVLLYGDRMVESSPSPSSDQEPVPTSGRGIHALDLMPAAMETLVAAVVADGAIPTVTRKPKLVIFNSIRLHLRLAERSITWPAGSPEERLVDWLDRQPARTGSFEEACVALFIPKASTNAWVIGFRSLHRGLIDRGYVARQPRKVLKVLTKEGFVLTQRHHQQFQGAASAFAQTHLTVRDRLPAEVRDAAMRSWRAAWGSRDIEIG